MDLSTISVWCWLIPLVVGLLCAFFGYLIGRGGKTPDLDTDRIRSLEQENEKLAAELASCQEKANMISGKSELSDRLGEPGIQTGGYTGNAIAANDKDTFDAAAAKAALGKDIKQNDLKLIEGIGPKIENLFHTQGIHTWLGLADLSVARCREILMTGGPRYRLHDPASWPMQARMAAEGKWKDLARWQDDHKHGRL